MKRFFNVLIVSVVFYLICFCTTNMQKKEKVLGSDKAEIMTHENLKQTISEFEWDSFFFNKEISITAQSKEFGCLDLISCIDYKNRLALLELLIDNVPIVIQRNDRLIFIEYYSAGEMYNEHKALFVLRNDICHGVFYNLKENNISNKDNCNCNEIINIYEQETIFEDCMRFLDDFVICWEVIDGDIDAHLILAPTESQLNKIEDCIIN